MKFISIVLVTFTAFSQNVVAETCTIENLKAANQHLTETLVETIATNSKLIKALYEDRSQQGFKILKKHIIETKNSQPASKSLAAFMAKHPECDEKKLFQDKTQITE